MSPILLLAINDNFLGDIMTFCQIQQLKYLIYQRGSLHMHQLHCLQSQGLHHQCSQKFSSLNPKASPQNLMNLASIASTKLILLLYQTKIKVLTTAVMLLDLQLLLAQVLKAGGPVLDAKFQTFRLKPLSGTFSHHFSMLQSFAS